MYLKLKKKNKPFKTTINRPDHQLSPGSKLAKLERVCECFFTQTSVARFSHETFLWEIQAKQQSS